MLLVKVKHFKNKKCINVITDFHDPATMTVDELCLEDHDVSIIDGCTIVVTATSKQEYWHIHVILDNDVLSNFGLSDDVDDDDVDDVVIDVECDGADVVEYDSDSSVEYSF